jgi:hypothetical protein
MSYIITVESTLNKVAAPNLPLAPKKWDSRYQDQFANVLRLYFNQLDKTLQQLQVSTVDSNNAQTQIWLGNSGGLFSG